MPVKAIPRVSIGRNGLGSFVPSCNKITIQYCNWGGSSSSLRKILNNGELNNYMKIKSNIFFEIKQNRGHPKLIFNYSGNGIDNGNKEEIIDIKNLKDVEIFKKLDEFSSRSGQDLFKFNHKVKSINDSVRGIWSPLHTPKDHRHKI